MRISIRHQMSVTPPAGSAHAVLQLLLTPTSGATQKIVSWNLEMAGIGEAAQFKDAFGNTAHLVNQIKPEGELLVTVTGVVETTDRHGVIGRPGGEPVPALYRRNTPLTKASVTLYGKFRNSKDSRLDVLHALMARVGELLDGPAAEGQSQSQTQNGQSQSQSQGQRPAEAVLVPLEGVEHQEAAAKLPRPPATDYAHAFIGAARALGIPARYVTGYLLGDEDEASCFHVWAEAFDEGLGWIGFDPMLQLCPTDRHVRLAAGLDALSATPLRAVPAGDGTIEVSLSVTVE
jgi:transglutaminase-like putative cysteine protease